MRDWLRRIDPAFYRNETYLLRMQAQIDRYTDQAQAEVRLSVLRADRTLHVATATIAFSAYAVATGTGILDARAEPLTLWAFAVLAVAAPRSLPWRPHGDVRVPWRDALIGSALIAMPEVWVGFDRVLVAVALLAGAALSVARGRGRLALVAAAITVLLGVQLTANPLSVNPLAGVLAAAAGVLAARAIARVWPVQPQIATWSAFAALLLSCGYTFAFHASAVALRVPGEIAAIAVAYLGVCVMAGRIRRAERIARPSGVLSLPQSIVPLFDRSHHHAVICTLA